jgi:hypothetical protein
VAVAVAVVVAVVVASGVVVVVWCSVEPTSQHPKVVRDCQFP